MGVIHAWPQAKKRRVKKKIGFATIFAAGGIVAGAFQELLLAEEFAAKSPAEDTNWPFLSW